MRAELLERKERWLASAADWDRLLLPPSKQRLLVLVPHPDDEIIGCAGFLQTAGANFAEIRLLYVTSGEASHGDLSPYERDQLAARRRLESATALKCLNLSTPVSVSYLGMPDSQVQTHLVELQRLLEPEVEKADLVLAPYEKDGHCDHNAIGAVAVELQSRYGFQLFRYPIWLWFWFEADKEMQSQFRIWPFDEPSRIRKTQALKCFESQLGPEPILPEEFMKHYTEASYECFLVKP